MLRAHTRKHIVMKSVRCFCSTLTKIEEFLLKIPDMEFLYSPPGEIRSDTCWRLDRPIWYDMMYLLTAVGLSPGGSTHLHTNNTQNNTNNNRTTQITTNVEECGPCPVFASFTLAFALQLRKKHRKPSVRVRKTSVVLRKTSVRVQCTYYQNTHTLQNPHIWRK